MHVVARLGVLLVCCVLFSPCQNVTKIVALQLETLAFDRGAALQYPKP